MNLAKPHKSIDNPVPFCSPLKERLRKEAGRFLQRFTVLYLFFFFLNKLIIANNVYNTTRHEFLDGSHVRIAQVESSSNAFYFYGYMYFPCPNLLATSWF